MTTLPLTAESLGRRAVPTENGAMLTVDGDNSVTLIVAPGPAGEPAQDVGLQRDEEPVPIPAFVGEDGAHRWELDGPDRFGTFRASASLDGEPVESAELTVTQQAPGPAVEADAGGVVEVQVGQYDARFAQWVGIVFAGLALTLVLAVSLGVLGSVDWSGAAPAAGTFAERSRLAIAAVLATVGGVQLLAGAALAALEVRGRQRSTSGSAVRTRGAAEVLDKVPAILQRAGLLRATIAVLVTGGLVLLLAVVILVGFEGIIGGPVDAGAPQPAASAAEA